MSDGLNKDGGISFSRKTNFGDKKKEPEMFSRRPEDKIKEEPKKERNIDVKELAKAERLNAKLAKAKGIITQDSQLTEVPLLVLCSILIVFFLTLLLWIL